LTGLDVFAIWLSGAFSGAIATVIYGLYLNRKDRAKLATETKKLRDELDKKIENIKKQAKKIDEGDVVNERLARVGDITERQLALQAQASLPSKNAVHSKHKNGVIREIQALEDEKAMILQSILDDGFDPMVVALNEKDERENIKLSEYMAKNGLSVPKSDTSETKTPANIPTETLPGEPRKAGKFLVYKGGKSDSSH
jgi:hypothetical protein